MPKNIFQRPQPIKRSSNVPRHGAPLPMSRLEARKIAQPKPDKEAPPLPALDVLLGKTPQS